MKALALEVPSRRAWLCSRWRSWPRWSRRWFINDYLLTILIVIFYFAYTAQAWNIMMGFAGQLSLGHALYVGLGAYTTAALYVHFGVASLARLAGRRR